MRLFPPYSSIAAILDRSPPHPTSPISSSPPPTPPSSVIKLNSAKTDSLPVNIKTKLLHLVNDLNAICNKTKQNKVLKNISRYSPENSFNFLYRAVFLNIAFFTIPLYKMEQAFPAKKNRTTQ